MFLFPPLSFMGVLILGSNIYAMRNLFLEGLAIQLASQYSKFVELEEEVEAEIQNQRYNHHQRGTDADYRHNNDALPKIDILKVLPEDRVTVPIAISDRSPRDRKIDNWINGHHEHQLGVSLDSTFERDPRPGPSRGLDGSIDIIHNTNLAENDILSAGDLLLPPPRLANHSSSHRPHLGERTMTISRSERYKFI